MPTSFIDSATGVVAPGLVGIPPTGYGAYPRVSDLMDFLSDAPFRTPPIVQRLSGAVLAGIEQIENRCQRHFVAGQKVDNSDDLPATRVYDPPAFRSAFSYGACLDFGPWGDLARLDSVVYQPQGGTAQTLVAGTDYRAMPQNNPARGRPYTYLEMQPHWWSPFPSTLWASANWGSMAVTGLWGYASILPADVWLAMLSASAISLFSSAFVSAGVPVGIKSWTGPGGVQTVYSDLLVGRLQQWQSSVDQVIETYERLEL